ncbi:MAG TPA: hypothetical protein VLI45_03575 [Acidobacteriaceae bacterium]|nr:hypothetical protein [Acidobacteriaceae bacterium]
MAVGHDGLQDVLLHLPASLRDRAEEMASRECLSLNLFLVMAVAEKLQRLQLSGGQSREQDLPSSPIVAHRPDLVH